MDENREVGMSYKNRIIQLQLKENENQDSLQWCLGFQDACYVAGEIGSEADAEVFQLRADLDRLHRERDAFQEQCRVMADENGLHGKK